MARIPDDSQLQKGSKIAFKWEVNYFKPQLFSTSDFECFEGPQFKVGRAAFKISLVPWYIECPGKVACVLTREDNASGLVYYFFDFEITVDKKICKQRENVCCFRNSDSKYLPLMNLSDLRNKNKYPTHCKWTIQFKTREYSFKRSYPRYISATSELSITTETCVFPLVNIFSPKEESEDVSRSGNGESELSENRPPITGNQGMKMWWNNRHGQNIFRTFFSTDWHLVFCKYEVFLIDVKRKISIATRRVGKLVFNSEVWCIDLILPECILEEIRKSNPVFKSFVLLTHLSYHGVEMRRYRKFESGSRFLPNRKNNLNLKYDLKNLYHNGTNQKDLHIKGEEATFPTYLKNFNQNSARSYDICIKGEETMFQVHKCILASRSPVYNAMLENNTLERRTGLINIVEMNSKELRLLLSFIYSSEFDEVIDYENAVSLHAAADKYQIPSLSSVCRRELKKNISLNNLHELWLLSYLHRDLKLKDFITSFLKTWSPNPDVISHLEMMFDQPLSEEDVEFIGGVGPYCRLTSERKGASVELIPQLRSCTQRISEG